MMFLLPLLSFFFSRGKILFDFLLYCLDMLRSYGHSEKDQSIYAGFISLACVILVIISYVLRILGDQDNWTPSEQEQKKENKKFEMEIEGVGKEKNTIKVQGKEENVRKNEPKKVSSQKAQENKKSKDNKDSGERNEGQDKESTLRKRDVPQKNEEKDVISQTENKDQNKNEQVNDQNKKKEGSKNQKKKGNKNPKA